MPEPQQNRSVRGSQFEHLLAEMFRRAGWRVRREEIAGGRPDLLVEHGSRKYLIELKVSSEGRNDRAIPLISQGILEVRHAARRIPGSAIPVAVLAANHISEAIAERVKEFARQNAPSVGVGIIDAEGFRSFAGHGLESLNAKRPSVRKVELSGKGASSANLFSDLNQWMLKVLLAQKIPAAMISSPRGQYENASQLAVAAGVSVMSSFRFVRRLSEDGFLEDQGVIRLVQIEKLLERWRAASQRRVRQIPVRWIMPGAKNHVQAAVRSYLSNAESRSSREPRAHAGGLVKAPPRICIGFFAAADELGVGFVHGVPAQIYLERLDRDALEKLGLSVENAEHQPDLFVRVPDSPEAVFRAAVHCNGVLFSDILQVWLDVSHHPARGQEQADMIRKKILSSLFRKERG